MSRNILSREEEADLVADLVQGNPAAIKRFFEQYKSLIYGTIRKFSFIPSDNADDYFQEFLFRLMEDDWRRLSSWRGESKLSTYLVTVLRNYIMDQKRKHADTASIDDVDEPKVEPFKDKEEDMDLATMRRHLNECVQALSERDQDIFTRAFKKEEGAEDIATALAVSKNTYYKAVHDIKSRLGKCMKKDFPFYFAETENNG